MSVAEIITGSVVLIVSLLIIVLCQFQDQKQQQNMTAALTGSNNDSFYGKNAGETKEAALKKLTRILAVILFVGTILVNLLPKWLG